jgi:hypothetical protein
MSVAVRQLGRQEAERRNGPSNVGATTKRAHGAPRVTHDDARVCRKEVML